MPSEATRAKALKALDGMREIVRAEMLTAGTYVSSYISNPNRLGSICGGRKHCAIGSLWAGYGVKRGKYGDMAGTDQDVRAHFLRPRHGLRLAYDALNQAAQEFVTKHDGISPREDFVAPLEALFEGSWDDGDLTKRDLLGIIAAAKRKVRAA